MHLNLIVYLFGVMGITFYYGAPDFDSEHYHDIEFANWKTFPLFIGTSLYSLEGINGVLPVESSLKNPKQSTPVFATAIAIYAIVVAFFGAFGYIVQMRFSLCLIVKVGYSRCGVVTDCLPDGIPKIVLQVALCLALLFTHPIQLFPASEIVESHIFRHKKAKPKCFLLKCCVIRTVEVLATCAIGACMPNFALFSNLVGSLFLSFSGFILPPILFIKLVKFRNPIMNFALMSLSGCLLAFGFIFLCVGTTSSIVAIIEAWMER